jgi:hypothetical protein
MADTNISLPLGRAIYPSLKIADTKFHELGQYKCNVSVPIKEASGTMDKLTSIFKEHTGKPPIKTDNTMWKMEIDADTGEETGNVIFKCAVKNVQRRDGELWDRRPKQFDAKMNPVNLDPFGGTEMYVSASVYAWSAAGKKGVSLQPMAVQIINLVERSGGNAEGFGFQAQEGFQSEETNYNFGEKNETTQEEESFEDF